jgi:hypothetical protein
MKRQFPRSAILIVTFGMIASGLAIADDSSLSRFGGDGYAYFNQDDPGHQRISAGPRPTSVPDEGESKASRSPRAAADGEKRLRGRWWSSDGGRSYEEYQALSSNSGRWQPPGAPASLATQRAAATSPATPSR